MYRPLKPYFLAPLFLQKLIWIPTRLVLSLFGRHRVYGLENLKGIKNPVIFACNHSSEIDAFMTPASLPFWSHLSPLFYVVREKDFYEANGWRKHLFNTWFISLWGGYGAKVGLRDYGASLRRQIEILKDGGSFCIFPEGGITKDGMIQQPKGGIAYLAHAHPCTIIPVGISGVYDMSPGDFFKGRRKICVQFGKSIQSEDLWKLVPQSGLSGTNVWKAEAAYIMDRVGELVMHST